MTARHAALSIGAVLVLGLGVYLLVEVRAQPVEPGAGASPPAVPERAARAAPPVAAAPAEPTPAAAEPAPPAPPPPHPAPGLSRAAADGIPAPSDLDPLAGPKFDSVMAEANKAYDRGDFDDAKTIAARLLAHEPTNIRMLRIMVSASCIDGDSAAAQAHFARLPPGDQAQMRTRCSRYGISFPDTP